MIDNIEDNSTPHEFKDKLSYPMDVELIGIYTGIKDGAIEAIRQGKVMGNPILQEKDKCYAISPDVPLVGSSVHPFLSDVIDRIKSLDPTAVCLDPSDLHISLGEVFFNPSGRRDKLNSEQVREFYKAIRDGISDLDPIRLSLFGIIPALDPSWDGHSKRSISIVAAFLPDDNPAIYQLADEIQNSAQKVRDQNHLEAKGPRVGRRKVLLVSLARLMKEPEKKGEEIPILSLLDKVNRNISKGHNLTVEKVNIISTTPINYIMPKGYVTLDPPIFLKKDQRLDVSPKFVRPSQFQPK